MHSAISLQNRNAIQQRIRRHLPDIWPVEKLSKEQFYERLLETIEGDKSRVQCDLALDELLERRPKWRNEHILPLRSRVVQYGRKFWSISSKKQTQQQGMSLI